MDVDCLIQFPLQHATGLLLCDVRSFRGYLPSPSHCKWKMWKWKREDSFKQLGISERRDLQTGVQTTFGRRWPGGPAPRPRSFLKGLPGSDWCGLKHPALSQHHIELPEPGTRTGSKRIELKSCRPWSAVGEWPLPYPTVASVIVGLASWLTRHW